MLEYGNELQNESVLFVILWAQIRSKTKLQLQIIFYSSMWVIN
jgi:hypothetical protein